MRKEDFLSYECEDVVIRNNDGSIIEGIFYYSDADETDDLEDSIDIKIKKVIQDNKDKTLSKFKGDTFLSLYLSEISEISLLSDYKKKIA